MRCGGNFVELGMRDQGFRSLLDGGRRMPIKVNRNLGLRSPRGAKSEIS